LVDTQVKSDKKLFYSEIELNSPKQFIIGIPHKQLGWEGGKQIYLAFYSITTYQ